MKTPPKMRLRLTLSKTDAMRFTGHLDFHNTLIRTLRRARLPLSYSEGFTRRPKMQIASALPLGFTSECEVVDVWLDTRMPVQAVREVIREKTPPGLVLTRVEEVEISAPKLQQELRSADYLVTLAEVVPDLENRVAEFLRQRTLLRERRGKTYDLRPLVFRLENVERDAKGGQHLKMTLSAQEGATGRPDEVLVALGIDPLRARYHRVGLHFREQVVTTGDLPSG